MESLVSGFVIHLRVSLTEEEGDAFMGALGADRMEDHPVVEVEGDMEVVDADLECRDSTIGSNGQSKSLERLLRL